MGNDCGARCRGSEGGKDFDSDEDIIHEEVISSLVCDDGLIIIDRYNASEHPVLFYKALDLGKAPKKLSGGPAPDLEEAFVSYNQWFRRFVQMMLG